MDKVLFDELLASVREAGQIRRGARAPARRFEFSAPDIKAIRDKAGLTQSDFANLMGVSVNTLQNWEQGRRHPHGPALALLKVAEKNLPAVVEAVHAA